VKRSTLFELVQDRMPKDRRPSRFMELLGWEEFGLRSVQSLASLGSRRVTVNVYWSTPPLKALIPLTPRERRRLVSKTHQENLRKFFASAPGARRILGQKGLLSLTAETLTRIPRIKGLGPIWIDSIQGLHRRKVPVRKEIQTFSVKVRLAEEIAGKLRGVQHVDERTVSVRGRDKQDAVRKVERHFAHSAYSSVYALPSGAPVRWRFEGIVDVCRVVVDPLRDGVTTLWMEGSRRKIKPGTGWNPKKS
jgi:hypothetical protein